MFDSNAGEGFYIPRGKGFSSGMVSGLIHSVVVVILIVVPLLVASDRLPEPPVMMAFVAVPPAPPPPPPPPAPAAPKPAAARELKQITAGEFAAPVEAPSEIVEESGVQAGIEGGVAGGVEGGVPGGVLGGVLGGLPAEAPPPPPPAPEAVAPVRVGGEIVAPALVRRIDPEYPEVALLAQLQGMVILEATVDEQGRVQEVRVLRSVGLLDEAAVNAVRQWQYRPLTLNGKPTPFVLTVTVAFELEQPTRVAGRQSGGLE